MVRLERVDVRLTDSSAGQALRRHLSHRHRGLPAHRIAQGVLSLPTTFREYLSGRSRQALRTNLHRADDLKIAYAPVRHTSDRRRLLERWLNNSHPSMDQADVVNGWIGASPSDADWWVASDPDGVPLALAVVSIDAEWALLHGLVSHSHPARWLIHSSVVLAVIEAGARHMCVTEGNALLMSAQLQYFQRLLGYRVAHLHLHDRSR
jgi:hypothetical protein